jgi:hypothetical protein
MGDYSIRDVTVQDISGINGALQPTVSKRVTFYVGGSGPFFLTYAPDQYDAGVVLADMQKEADTLKAIGAKANL